ncbi:MAG: RsmB/NOP family class I SAM-dependent RNA methyltransferase [Alphaproteobacteria bacterium]
MTPAARAQAVIELFTECSRSTKPADSLLGGWLRARRYIGAKDRGEISRQFWDIWRHWSRLHWRMEHAPFSVALHPQRLLYLAWLAMVEKTPIDRLPHIFDGSRFAPMYLEQPEVEAFQFMAKQQLNSTTIPSRIRLECPEWAYPMLQQEFGQRLESELEALISAAPTDIRVNPLMSTREKVMQELENSGFTGKATAFSPYGIRLNGRFPILTHQLYQNGAIEIQDESSQIAALLVQADSSMRVLDLCAGAGGKTLMLAAAMENKGTLVATDLLEGRLKRAAERLRRAGVHNTQTKPLDAAGRDWLKRQYGRFDRVMVDAPCSGSGTWRRNPDMRWRGLAPQLETLYNEQKELLQLAQKLVKPGGRLIYSTCSLFTQENEQQVEALLANNPEFQIIPARQLWYGLNLGEAPASVGQYLRLSPALSQTDGFFAAVLERKNP